MCRSIEDRTSFRESYFDETLLSWRERERRANPEPGVEAGRKTFISLGV